jgi:hypothetical protein
MNCLLPINETYHSLDPEFMEQKGVRSLVDKDASVGRKTKTDDFWGYKVETAMITDERIMTAVTNKIDVKIPVSYISLQISSLL